MDTFSQSLLNAPASSAQNYQDVASLDNLRKEAQADEKAALNKVAKQFEGIFMKMLLKSMREANKAFESDSPFNSQGTETYRNMHDDQMALELSESGSLGLADLIVQQLSPQTSGITPSSALRTGNNSNLSLSTTHVTTSAANENTLTAKEQPQNSLQTSFNSPTEFIETMLPLAQEASEKIGVSPQTLLAQAALETGWGKKIVGQKNDSSSFNLFNIKSDKRWSGEQVDVQTIEYRDGVPLKENASFRSYDSFKQSFDDFTDFITNSPRYEKALDNTSDSASFLQGLQEAGYATDPQYASKIMAVLKQVIKIAP